MTEIRQKMRGSTAQNNNYLGPVGQITGDTDENDIRVHDGVTPGGHRIANLSFLDNRYAAIFATIADLDGVRARLDAIESPAWVIEDRIADGAVTNPKLADMAAWTIKGRNAATDGVPSDIDIATLTVAEPAIDDLLLINDTDADGELKSITPVSLVNVGAINKTFHHDSDTDEPTAEEWAAPPDGATARVINTTDDLYAIYDRQADAWVPVSIGGTSGGGNSVMLSIATASRPVGDATITFDPGFVVEAGDLVVWRIDGGGAATIVPMEFEVGGVWYPATLNGVAGAQSVCLFYNGENTYWLDQVYATGATYGVTQLDSWTDGFSACQLIGAGAPDKVRHRAGLGVSSPVLFDYLGNHFRPI